MTDVISYASGTILLKLQLSVQSEGHVSQLSGSKPCGDRHLSLSLRRLLLSLQHHSTFFSITSFELRFANRFLHHQATSNPFNPLYSVSKILTLLINTIFISNSNGTIPSSTTDSSNYHFFYLQPNVNASPMNSNKTTAHYTPSTSSGKPLAH